MYDVVVVGGSYAGLAAALQLGRTRRNVLVVDAGQRRNLVVAHAHGILGHDGESPAAIAAKAKSDVLRYPTVRWLEGTVAGARAVPGGFTVSAGGEEHATQRIILATGVVDDVPPIAGIRERWGKTVFHCPYCDGYELHRGRLGVLAAGPLAVHYATIVNDWGAPGATVLFLHGGDAPAGAELAELASRGIHVESNAVLEGRDAAGGIEILVGGGQSYDLAALFIAPRTHLPGSFATELGCELESGPRGSLYKTDPLTKETTVRGVFACGDAALAQHSVTFAMADGARAGIFAHQSLVFPREAPLDVRTGAPVAR